MAKASIDDVLVAIRDLTFKVDGLSGRVDGQYDDLNKDLGSLRLEVQSVQAMKVSGFQEGIQRNKVRSPYMGLDPQGGIVGQKIIPKKYS